MNFFIEAVLMGLFATLFMDVTSTILGKSKIIKQLISPEIVGRWTLYMLKGKFIHKDIQESPTLKNEKPAALLSHYLIGIALAGIYLLLEIQIPSIRQQMWVPLAFGIATVLLPWFWLFPSIGIGLLASKAPEKSSYIITSLVNHTNFGIGFVLWIECFRGIMM